MIVLESYNLFAKTKQICYNLEGVLERRGKMELTIIISIVSITIAIASFVLNRKDKSNQDTEKDSYKWGSIDEKFSNIEKTLSKIEDKLDTYDKEIDDKIDKAIEQHIIAYHKGK